MLEQPAQPAPASVPGSAPGIFAESHGHLAAEAAHGHQVFEQRCGASREALTVQHLLDGEEASHHVEEFERAHPDSRRPSFIAASMSSSDA
ncbi:hypothetical protein [Streptomyces sp. KL116D]|uniref:hypothetical protein n=1 Tax=Streptomyces sp. KL116D TaxID=3045152 RepID=UPI0035561415